MGGRRESVNVGDKEGKEESTERKKYLLKKRVKSRGSE